MYPLSCSRIFVPLLSRDALKNKDRQGANFEALTAASAVDNVLLEYRLAIELKARQRIEKVFPIFIGACVNGTYRKYELRGNDSDLPRPPAVCVASVEAKVRVVSHAHASPRALRGTATLTCSSYRGPCRP